MRNRRKAVSLLLAISLMLTTLVGGDGAQAAKKTSAKVSSVKITNVGRTMRLQKGKTFKLKTSVKVKPNKSKNKKVKFTSSNRKVVLVNSRGKMKGIKVGTTKITAASRINPKKKAVISVSVTKDVLVSSIKLNKTKITAEEYSEEEIPLKVTKILPANAKNKEVVWSTDDEDVADVDDDGVVTTGEVGTATITATAADKGGAYATCKVVVTENKSQGSDDGNKTEQPPAQEEPGEIQPPADVPTQEPGQSEESLSPEEPEETISPTLGNVTAEPTDETTSKPTKTPKPAWTPDPNKKVENVSITYDYEFPGNRVVKFDGTVVDHDDKSDAENYENAHAVGYPEGGIDVRYYDKVIVRYKGEADLIGDGDWFGKSTLSSTDNRLGQNEYSDGLFLKYFEDVKYKDGVYTVEYDINEKNLVQGFDFENVRLIDCISVQMANPKEDYAGFKLLSADFISMGEQSFTPITRPTKIPNPAGTIDPNKKVENVTLTYDYEFPGDRMIRFDGTVVNHEDENDSDRYENAHVTGYPADGIDVRYYDKVIVKYEGDELKGDGSWFGKSTLSSTEYGFGMNEYSDGLFIKYLNDAEYWDGVYTVEYYIDESYLNSYFYFDDVRLIDCISVQLPNQDDYAGFKLKSIEFISSKNEPSNKPSDKPSVPVIHGLSNPTINDDEVTTWDCVYFGNYWQNDTNGDGIADADDEKQPIKWRVLSVDGGDAFLLADENLDSQPYNDELMAVTWETSTLRSWLNDDFFAQAFTAGEQSAVIKTVVVNKDNTVYGTEGGEDTEDYVYLLSEEEVRDRAYGFSADTSVHPAREARNTAYAKTQGAKTSLSEKYKDNGVWWLRSPANGGRGAIFVNYYGLQFQAGTGVDDDRQGVRPALHLNLSSTSGWSYAGTVTSEQREPAKEPEGTPDPFVPEGEGWQKLDISQWSGYYDDNGYYYSEEGNMVLLDNVELLTVPLPEILENMGDKMEIIVRGSVSENSTGFRFWMTNARLATISQQYYYTKQYGVGLREVDMELDVEGTAGEFHPGESFQLQTVLENVNWDFSADPVCTNLMFKAPAYGECMEGVTVTGIWVRYGDAIENTPNASPTPAGATPTPNIIDISEYQFDVQKELWTNNWCEREDNADGSVTLTRGKGEEDWQVGEFGFVVPKDKVGDVHKFTKIVIKYRDSDLTDSENLCGYIFHMGDETKVGCLESEGTDHLNSLSFDGSGETVIETGETKTGESELNFSTIRVFGGKIGGKITIESVTLEKGIEEPEKPGVTAQPTPESFVPGVETGEVETPLPAATVSSAPNAAIDIPTNAPQDTNLPMPPKQLDMQKTYMGNRSQVGITPMADGATKFLYTEKYQGVFFDMSEIDFTELEAIRVTANVPAQLSFTFYGADLDFNVEEWWSVYNIMQFYPFWCGSYEDRAENGGTGGQRGIETYLFDLSEMTKEELAKIVYLSIGSNDFGEDDYLIYSIEFVRKGELNAIASPT